MALPDELFDEILIWVPVKYLLRCRCVSKGWCSVIDSTKFVEKYLKVSVESNRGGLIVQGDNLDDSDKKYLLADLECLEDGSAVSDISEEVGGILNGARLMGSDNGLVCFSRSEGGMDSIILLNPCTRKCKKLPDAGKEILENNNLTKYFIGGFGYDHVSDDYKVVMMAWCKLPINGIMAIVYSLKKKLWTVIADVFSTENIDFADTWGRFAYGVLRWKAFNLTSREPVIVGFDLGLERFIEAQCCDGIVHLLDIYIENSRAEELSENPVFISLRSCRLLVYSKNLEKILLEVDRRGFMWYDFRSKELKEAPIPGIPYVVSSRRYVESLFPLIEDGQP